MPFRISSCLSARCSRSPLRLFPGLDRICLQNSTIRFPNFNLTALDSSLQTRLRMYGGTIYHVTIPDRKARTVPRTLDDVAVELAFGERTAKMRAGLSQGEYLRPTPDEQDRCSVVLGTNWLSLA